MTEHEHSWQLVARGTSTGGSTFPTYAVLFCACAKYAKKWDVGGRLEVLDALYSDDIARKYNEVKWR